MHTLLEAYGPDAIDLQSFEVHDTLDQRIWDGDKLKPEIRERLLEIADQFAEYLGVPVTVEDVIFTGSLANYNYSKYSDIDLHLVLDFGEVNEDEELVRELMTAKKTIWNDLHDITVKGAEVELYAQDKNEPHEASGQYSVKNDEWNVKPERAEPSVDMSSVHEKASDMMAQIDHALTDPDCPASCLDTLKDKIKRMRKSGLEKGGEFSVENLAFKVMRRNGYLEKLWEKSVEATDDELSLESESLNELFLHEVPIRDIERVGTWRGRGQFRAQDQKLLTSPKAIEKIKRQWEKTPYTFDIYLMNVPALNKPEFKEYGEVVPGSDLANTISEAIGQPMPNSADAITILFNGNYGTQKVPMTGWIMAHRVGHVVSRGGDSSGAGGYSWSSPEAWDAYASEVQYMLREILQAFHRVEDLLRGGQWGMSWDNQKKLKYIVQQLGTFRSARQGKLVNFYEFYHELLAQWLITGSIKFNPLPYSLVTGKRHWGHEDRTSAKDREWLDQINEMLPDYAAGIEHKLEQLFDGIVGKTFLM